MRNFILSAIALFGFFSSDTQAKDLVAYFSAQGHTKAVAERIAELTGADIYRIEAAEPYAENPYDDSDRVQNEAYNDLRPGVTNMPAQEWIDQYDRIFIGSPCWWHQPAMVVCTFLENYDLSKQVIIPFFTYGATTYLNESMHKIYKCTPNSVHVPEMLPEDLDPDDITRPGRPDDAGIDMPGNARGVEDWLNRLGLLNGSTGIADVANEVSDNIKVYTEAETVNIELSDNMSPNTISLYNLNGALVQSMSGRNRYSFQIPAHSVYLISMVYGADNKRVNKKISL